MAQRLAVVCLGLHGLAQDSVRRSQVIKGGRVVRMVFPACCPLELTDLLVYGQCSAEIPPVEQRASLIAEGGNPVLRGAFWSGAHGAVRGEGLFDPGQLDGSQDKTRNRGCTIPATAAGDRVLAPPDPG